MFESIKEMICNYVDVDPSAVTPEAALRSDLSMSSLDLINLAVEVEDTYNIKLPDNDISGIVTVNDLIRYISMKK